jgi:hypothetical protein
MRKYFLTFISILLAPSFATAEKSCAPDFSSFLVKFESSKEFQKQYTKLPLTTTFVDENAVPEPKTVVYVITSTSDPKYSKTSYPSKKKQAQVPFEKLVSTKQDRTIVQFTKPDTDYSFAFTFEKSPACWQLTKFEDFSL